VLLDAGDVRRLVVGAVIMSALWAALGVGLGALVRNQVLAIVGLYVWVFVVEILLFQYLPDVGRYAPGAAGTAMTGDTVGDSSINLLSAPAGGGLLALYAAALVTAGAVAVARRDVT
jgi:ABC-2 type transport system permease protein